MTCSMYRPTEQNKKRQILKLDENAANVPKYEFQVQQYKGRIKRLERCFLESELKIR